MWQLGALLLAQLGLGASGYYPSAYPHYVPPPVYQQSYQEGPKTLYLGANVNGGLPSLMVLQQYAEAQGIAIGGQGFHVQCQSPRGGSEFEVFGDGPENTLDITALDCRPPPGAYGETTGN